MGARKMKPGNVCQACEKPRGKNTAGWSAIIVKSEVLGYTCPDCPMWREPIRLLDNGRFRAVVNGAPENGKRKQVNRVFDTLADARAFVAAAESAADTSAVPTVAELIEMWLADLVDVRPVTLQGYRHMLATVLRRIGTMRITDVNRDTVKELRNWLMREGGRRGQPLSARSVKAALGRLQTAFDFAVDSERIPVTTNPVKGVKRPRQKKRVGKNLEHWRTKGEGKAARCKNLNRFVQVTADDAFAPLWRLTACGMTRADIMGLRWSDIDFTRGVLTVSQGRVALDGGHDIDDPKSPQRSREVRFEHPYPGTTAMLRTMKAKQAADRLSLGPAWRDTGLVAVDESGTPLRPEVYSDRFRRLCESNGLPPIRLHSVRHSLAFLLHRRGVAPTDVAALLGHSVEVHMSTYLPQGKSSVATDALAEAVAA